MTHVEKNSSDFQKLSETLNDMLKWFQYKGFKSLIS